MKKLDLNNIDYYGSGRFLIWGSVGSGKTLLLCYLLQNAMIDSLGFTPYIKDEVDVLNMRGFNFSKKFEHVVFSNFPVNSVGSSIPTLEAYKCNPYRFGFYGKFKTDVFPPHSVFGFTEFQNYCPSSMNDYIRPEVIRKWQTSRHDGIMIFCDVQRPYDIAKKIRELFDYYIECFDYKEILYDGYCIGHEWTLRIINDSILLEEYLKNRNKDLCTEITFKVNRCLYDNYDSFFCKDLHYKGFEKQDFALERFGFGDDDVLTTPDGYFVKKNELTNNSEESEVLF